MIDPQLRWSTFLGGSGADKMVIPNGLSIATDGDVLVTGITWSADFPTPNGLWTGPQGGSDAFVARLDPDAVGSAQLLWSTYFGGSGDEESKAVVGDETGRVLVGGLTKSADFPVCNGPYQTNQGSWDGFLARFSADGSQLEWSTYLGGTAHDTAVDILPDGPGAFLATGGTFSAGLATAGAYQQALAGARDAYVCRIDTTLPPASQVVWWTYLGGVTGDECGYHLGFDPTGAVIVGGPTGSSDLPLVNALQGAYGGGYWDQFIARLDASGTSLQWSTYLGGSDRETPNGMDVDGATGQVVVGGWTWSPNFPVTPNAYDPNLGGVLDVYVACIDPAEPPSGQLVWSSYLGGSLEDGANSVALEDRGAILVAGATASADFPCTPDAYDATYGGGWDVFVGRFDRSLTGAQQLTYCSFLGGTDMETALAVQQRSDSSMVIGGWTRSIDFPTNPGDYDPSHNGNQDVFLTCLDLPTRAYCFGEGCPCGNDDPQAGCANSTGVGASLIPIGSASVATDDLAFLGRNLLPGQAALLFVAQNALGGPGDFFGDGLRCAGGGLVRLGVRIPGSGGVATWGSGMAATGGWISGDVRRFQAWYRDPSGSPCGNGFNTSHAVEVEFM